MHVLVHRHQTICYFQLFFFPRQCLPQSSIHLSLSQALPKAAGIFSCPLPNPYLRNSLDFRTLFLKYFSFSHYLTFSKPLVLELHVRIVQSLLNFQDPSSHFTNFLCDFDSLTQACKIQKCLMKSTCKLHTIFSCVTICLVRNRFRC